MRGTKGRSLIRVPKEGPQAGQKWSPEGDPKGSWGAEGISMVVLKEDTKGGS